MRVRARNRASTDGLGHAVHAHVPEGAPACDHIGVYRQKQRHGCLTIYLALVIGIGAVISVFNLLELVAYRKYILPDERWLYVAAGLSAAASAVCGIALFQWKKWGFYGLLLVVVVNTGLKLITFEYSLGYVVAGFASLVILCAALQIGGEREAWKQLE